MDAREEINAETAAAPRQQPECGVTPHWGAGAHLDELPAEADMIVSGVVRIVVGNVRCCHLPDYLALVPRDSDGTATAAVCEDIPVPKDCQARAVRHRS